MRLQLKQLKHFSVETASSVKLGHVYDIVLDTEGQLVAQYIVKPSILSSKEYLISRDQIVRFEDKKMIVDDNSVQARSTSSGQEKSAEPSPEPSLS